jgi:hypothetical protein
MLSKFLLDQRPENKIDLSKFIISLADVLKKNIGAHSKNIILSLCKNLKHAHNNVRKITITVKFINLY